MTNTRSHGLYAGDTVTVGRGKLQWTVSFATEDAVFVTRGVPDRYGVGLKRYFYGPDQIATLKLVSR